MTTAAWPRLPSAAELAARPTLADAVAFGCGVFILLIYSQGWLAPLINYGDATAAGPLIRVIYFPAYAATLVLAAGAALRTLRGFVSTPLLILLLLIAAASWFWSSDPSATVRRFVALSFTVLGGVSLAARFRWSTLAEVCAAAFAILAVLSLVVTIVKPQWGLMSEIFPGAWRGLWLEKNNLGGNMTVGFGFCVAAAALAPRRRVMWALFAGLCVALVAVSTSKTALVVLALMLGCLGFVWLVRQGPTFGVAGGWLAVVGILIAVTGGIIAADAIFGLLGKDATLTGRTEIWDGISRVMRGHEWTGFGYGAIWDDENPYAPLAWITHYANFRAGHAHNGWMEIWLNVGLVGVIVFGLWFVEAWLRTLWTTFAGGEGAWIALPFMAAYSIAMLTESITLTWHDMRWVLFTMVAVKLALGADQVERWARFNSARP